ncbi:hypothetical protein ACOMHN_065934 [Nucella lapillus]
MPVSSRIVLTTSISVQLNRSDHVHLCPASKESHQATLTKENKEEGEEEEKEEKEEEGEKKEEEGEEEGEKEKEG